MKEVTYKVSNISCAGCANAISNVLRQYRAVDVIDVDLASKRVRVTFDELDVDEETLASEMARIGYPAQKEESLPID